MHGPFADEYWKAAATEIETLEAIKAWDIVECTKDMNVLQLTWPFKLKSFPDGIIKKFKAWICARGGKRLKELISLKLKLLLFIGQQSV